MNPPPLVVNHWIYNIFQSVYLQWCGQSLCSRWVLRHSVADKTKKYELMRCPNPTLPLKKHEDEANRQYNNIRNAIRGQEWASPHLTSQTNQLLYLSADGFSKPHLFITNEHNQKRHAVDLNSNSPLTLIINFSIHRPTHN